MTFQIGWSWVGWVAGWYMKFIRSDDTELRIAILPPELVTYDDYVYRT